MAKSRSALQIKKKTLGQMLSDLLRTSTSKSKGGLKCQRYKFKQFANIVGSTSRRSRELITVAKIAKKFTLIKVQ
jgi:hypothetical protein